MTTGVLEGWLPPPDAIGDRCSSRLSANVLIVVDGVMAGCCPTGIAVGAEGVDIADAGLSGAVGGFDPPPICLRFASHSSRNDEPDDDFGAPLGNAPAPSGFFGGAIRSKISRSTSRRGRAYLAADNRFSASLNCRFGCPIGGMPLILNGAEGTP